MPALEEVSKHNMREDCWIVINDKVYDVTQFLEKHPGSAKPLLFYAGRDATEGFKKIVKHSQNDSLPVFMETMCVGQLG